MFSVVKNLCKNQSWKANFFQVSIVGIWDDNVYEYAGLCGQSIKKTCHVQLKGTMLKKLGCYIINLCLTDLWKRGGVIIGTECADGEFLRVNVFLYCNIFSAISFSTLSLVHICDWCENNHTSCTPISGKQFFKNKSTRIVTVCQVYSVFEELSLIALYTLKNGFF